MRGSPHVRRYARQFFRPAGRRDGSTGHGGNELFTGAVVQADGKIVVAVSSGGADDAPVLELARFESNGALDTSFGTAGVLLLDRGAQDSNSLAQQPDGKILAGAGLLVARVNSDGSLDTTFGTAGFAPVISPASAIVLQSNAQILLPASRYNANGSVDTTFGTLGRIASLGPVSPARVQSDGKIVAAGAVTSKVILGQLPNMTSITGFGVTRYNANGTLDSSFGHQGGVVTDFSSVGPGTTPSDVAIESNGDHCCRTSGPGALDHQYQQSGFVRPDALYADRSARQYVWYGRQSSHQFRQNRDRRNRCGCDRW